MNSIPFFGQSTDDASVDYRQRLAERSWELIQLHPFFGDPLVLTKMEDLRQGEGIIDLVNTYAGITLFYGSIGLLRFWLRSFSGYSRFIACARKSRGAIPTIVARGRAWRPALSGLFSSLAALALFMATKDVLHPCGSCRGLCLCRHVAGAPLSGHIESHQFQGRFVRDSLEFRYSDRDQARQQPDSHENTSA